MKEKPFIRSMFDAIAPWYDLLNRSLSLGQDIYWRHKLIKAISVQNNAFVLDVACGTADVIISLISSKGRNIQTVGLDFSHEMLVIAKKKLKAKKLYNHAILVSGNALLLPFKEDSFDAVTIAFGIRNIINKKNALAEFYRVLKPGGRLGILELTIPEKPLIQKIYMLYFSCILPFLGRSVSGHKKAYSYLPESVAGFPPNTAFASTIQKAGFTDVQWETLTFGIATLFYAKKLIAPKIELIRH